MCDWIAKSFTPEVFWVMVTAFFTIALFLVAWRQLRDLARTSRTDLLYRLRKDFFGSELRTLTFLLDNGLLKFRAGPTAFFDVEEKQFLQSEIPAITTQWIDDYLGLLEDIAGLWKARDISLREGYHSFGYYVILACEDEAV